MVTAILTSLLLACSLLADEAYFIPPSGWDFVAQDHLAPGVKVGFVSLQKDAFSPSINLATEKGIASVEEYVRTILNLYANDPRVYARDLGAFATRSSPGRLIELEVESERGPLRLLQLIVVEKGCAYIVTASSGKEQFFRYLKEFERSLASFTLTSDLLKEVKEPLRSRLRSLKPQEAKKTDLRFFPRQIILEGVKSLREQAASREVVLTEGAEMGPYWQLLMLKKDQGK